MIPDFKGASNWRTFRDMIELKLDILKGKGGHPLSYILNHVPRNATRSNASRKVVDSIDLEEAGIYKTHTVHFGKNFKDDNKRVWNYLKSVLLNTPAYNHILEYDRTYNGREAWVTLKSFYEGEDFKQRLQDEAFAIFRNTVYRGDSQKFTFESYVQRHLKAHKLLLEAEWNEGRGMDDSSKIQNLRGGIRFEAGLEHALTTARTNGLMRKSFQEFASFLSAEVDQNKARRTEIRQTQRRVASVRSDNKRNNSHQGKNNSHKNYPSRVVGGKKVEGRFYSKDEFNKLTREQRRAVIELKRQHRRSMNEKSNIAETRIVNAIQEMTSQIADNIPSGEDIAESNSEEVGEKPEKLGTKRKKAQSGGVGKFLANRE